MNLKIDMNNTYTFNNICTADDIHIVILYVLNLEIVDI
jgi:hypothetical protein